MLHFQVVKKFRKYFLLSENESRMFTAPSSTNYHNKTYCKLIMKSFLLNDDRTLTPRQPLIFYSTILLAMNNGRVFVR